MQRFVQFCCSRVAHLAQPERSFITHTVHKYCPVRVDTDTYGITLHTDFNTDECLWTFTVILTRFLIHCSSAAFLQLIQPLKNWLCWVITVFNHFNQVTGLLLYLWTAEMCGEWMVMVVLSKSSAYYIKCLNSLAGSVSRECAFCVHNIQVVV